MIEQQLKTKIANTINNYKKKCGQLESEINTLKSSMSQLLSLPSGFYVDVDQQLSSLQEALISNNKDSTAIQQYVESLVTLLSIKKLKEQERFDEYSNQIKVLQNKLMDSERSAEEIKTILYIEQEKNNKDSLTQLPNRASYDEHILNAYYRWERGFGDLTIAIADIDHFKAINDNYGHLTGDNVLKKLATLFKNLIRKVDFVARYGGEEFIFVFERTTEENAKKILESLRHSIENCQFCYHDNKVDVTVSFGLTTLKPKEDLEVFFMRADAALYQAKRAGRNRVEIL